MFASLWQGTARHYMGVEATLAAHWECSLFRGTGAFFSPQKITAGRVMDNLIMADVILATFLTLPYTVPDSQTLLKIMEQSYWWHLSCISIICHISVSFVNSSSPFPIIIIIMYYQVQFSPCQAKEARLSTAVFVQLQYKPFSSMYLCLTSLHRCQCTAAFVQLQYKTISSTCAWLLHMYSHLCKISILVQL